VSDQNPSQPTPEPDREPNAETNPEAGTPDTPETPDVTPEAPPAGESAAPPPPPPPPPTAGDYPPPPPPPPGGAYPPPPAGGAYPPPPPGGAYPPPPPGGAYPAPAAGPTLRVGDALGYGWAALKKNLGPLVILAVVVIGVQVVLNLIGTLLDVGASSDSGIVAVTFSLVSAIFGLLAWVVGLVLAIGLIRAALAVLDGRTPTPNMLLEGAGLPAYILATILFSLATFVGILLCIIPGLVIAFLWQFYGYAIVDGGTTVGPTQALGRSFEVVKANIGELLVLWLAFIGIGLVVGLVAIIPFIGWLIGVAAALVLYPVVAISIAYAWRTLTGGQVAVQA
jgi:hypothetical protein